MGAKKLFTTFAHKFSHSMEQRQNIFPVLDRILQQHHKEKLLKQKAIAIWLTGLSGSGKTTIGLMLEKLLYDEGFLTQVLDGDNVRAGINKNLGFSDDDRLENIRRIAEVNKLLLHSGIITINCFVSPTEDIRQMAKNIIGPHQFVEVYVNAPLTVCEQRDVKGLYQKAREGKIKDFTGVSAPFQAPVCPDLEIHTDTEDITTSVQKLYDFIIQKIKFNEQI